MDTDKIFAGPVPQLYDRYLGPILFQPFAEVMAEHFGPADRTILETAAGTGIIARAIAAAFPQAAIVATDLNQAMLDVAAAKPAAGNIAWQQADAQALPFADGAFDAVVCGFGIMFMPDKAAAFREAKRVLRPGGRLIFTVWDSIDTHPVQQIADATVAAMFPENPPHFLARTPCGYHDRALIERDLRQAGFSSVDIKQVRREGDVASARDPATGFCQGTPLRAEIEARDPDAVVRATNAVATAIEQRFGNGPFKSPMQALLVTAS